MDFSLSSSQQSLMSEVIEFAQNNLVSAKNDSQEGFDPDLWLRCGTLKLQGLAIPESYGGRGLDALSTVLALEGLGYGCENGGLSFSICAHLFACTIPIWKHGSEDQKLKYLPGLSDGTLIATNAMTEEQGGSDAFNMKSMAESVHGEFKLSGRKTFCANAPVADLCVTYVSTDQNKGIWGGVSAFLLDNKEHGFVVEDEIGKLGLKSCSTGIVNLNDITVSEANLIGKKGGGGMIFTQSMEWERIGMAAMNVGTMTRLLEKVIIFSKKRKSAGAPISRNQSISHTLAEIKVHLEACKLLVYQAAWNLDNGKNVNQDASMAKLFASETFKSMTVKLMQIYASTGYTEGSEISRCLEDSLASTIYSGTSEIQKNIIAGWMKL